MRTLEQIDQAAHRSEAVANQLKLQMAGLTALIESLVEPLKAAGIEVDIPTALAAIAEQSAEVPADETSKSEAKRLKAQKGGKAE